MSSADQWLAIDVNPTTRREIEQLVAERDTAALEERLGSRLTFGTAGLRAPMGAGFNRMNDVTVVQASQGLAEYVKSVADEPSVVVGHDHRHNSQRFAELTAAVFLIKGFTVYYLGGGLAATPLVPFSVDQYSASAGVMITASHNPKNDNGYKVYWSNGCQIIPPHDQRIQHSILANLDIVFRDSTWDTARVFEQHSEKLLFVRDEIIGRYSRKVKSVLLKNTSFSFKAVYTAMHGVGAEFISQVVPHGVLVPVEQQCLPDPDFPTVKFPNPEEKGALDLAIEQADKQGISVVVANDPDADRFSAAVKINRVWRQLSGNELGYLFAQYVVSQKKDRRNVYLVNSTVSSQMIAAMAAVEGFHFQDTLTGFKWIGNKVIDLENAGYDCPFAFEEAIGFLFPVVHDKDGISALVMFLQMYQHWLDNDTDALQTLQQGYEKYGFFKECNGYYVVPDARAMEIIFQHIRSTGNPYPKQIGEFTVTKWRDLTVGYDSTTPDSKPTLPVDVSSQMITVSLQHEDDEIRFTARGSGTEPKLKVYIEARSSSEAKADALARQVWALLRAEWFKPDLHGLTERV
ncbi:hypothetical protein KL918_001792 [Ogataea parapolymorpha]|uniref:Phosphoglucomutase-3 n=1 Tax=Ogataea parapolymorpha (strain ATCC 26012 / BCRC 20466 / JCM 22074 / NRRL Y-7560 / DL-1) TaxID=871575 RepID=W1QCS6_OGAPD|nr:Phosphoglucomutase-3 [Ogataea parapolymorpha DL-1]ESW98817.1 Phosphoglucomutase-3 [Ogataea parapolymorpha DL-1]KAG7868134.1 hypothetical protein KL918_001792 [Ogataea parapolymorpha]KAG7874246.1 hypothetical protein KL916_001586 [Ogataea parapolymorpha]